MEPEAIQELLGKFGMFVACLGLLAVGLRWLGRRLRLFVLVPLLLFVLWTMPAAAQDPAPTPAPSPSPAPAVLAPLRAQLTLEAGAGTLSTRDTADAFLAARATLSIRVSERAIVGARGDLDRDQDGGDLSAASLGRLKESFRSIEAGVFARYYIARGVSIGGVMAVTYAVPWGQVEPRDPRLYTGEGIVCVDVDADGYACLGAGWRGPVGGYAVSAAISRKVKGTIATIDFDFPLASAADFVRSGGVERPYTVAVRVLVPLKVFKF